MQVQATFSLGSQWSFLFVCFVLFCFAFLFLFLFCFFVFYWKNMPKIFWKGLLHVLYKSYLMYFVTKIYRRVGGLLLFVCLFVCLFFVFFFFNLGLFVVVCLQSTWKVLDLQSKIQNKINQNETKTFKFRKEHV